SSDLGLARIAAGHRDHSPALLQLLPQLNTDLPYQPDVIDLSPPNMTGAEAGGQFHDRPGMSADCTAPGDEPDRPCQDSAADIQKHQIQGLGEAHCMHGAASGQQQPPGPYAPAGPQAQAQQSGGEGSRAIQAQGLLRTQPGRRFQRAAPGKLPIGSGPVAPTIPKPTVRHQNPASSSFTATGKPMTRKVQGKMHSTMGNSMRTGASSASLSAGRKRWLR